MRKLIRRLRRDQRGAAAVELALLAPMLVLLLVMGADGWFRANEAMTMQSAVQSAGRYYQMGGSDDAAARSIALAAWQGAPTDGAVTVTRSCRCAAAVVACSSLCADDDTPTALVNIAAQGTGLGLTGSGVLMQHSEMIRVR